LPKSLTVVPARRSGGRHRWKYSPVCWKALCRYDRLNPPRYAGAIHRLGDAGADRITQDGAASRVLAVADPRREPPLPRGHTPREQLQDRMERDVAVLLALARDRDGASDQVDVLTADRRDLADPQTGVRAEQDHRPSPPGHPRAEQDGEVLVGDRPRSTLGHLRGGRDQRRVILSPPGADQPQGTRRVSRRGRSPALISTTRGWPGIGRHRLG